MENNFYIVLMAVCAATLITGAFACAYELYRIVSSDAEARGLKHPKLWAVFAINGNNSSGLLPYLIYRRKHPYVQMTAKRREEIERRKKRFLAGLVFLAVGAIGMMCLSFMFAP